MLTIIIAVILAVVFWRQLAAFAVVAIVGVASFGALFALAAAVL